jgi:hypothetical protein
VARRDASANVRVLSVPKTLRNFPKPRAGFSRLFAMMTQLEKRGKGIILMHDFHRNTAEALPELLHRLKGSGYKVVHMVPRQSLTTLPKYDEMVNKQNKLSSNIPRPTRSDVRTSGQQRKHL